MKLSARCMIIRENLFARIASISSICLTLMLIRTELTAVSIITYSFSERWMTIGLSSSSRLVLRRIRLGALTWRTRGKSEAGGSYIPDLDLRLVVALDNLRGKVLDAQRRVKGRRDCVQVRPERGVRPHAGHGRPLSQRCSARSAGPDVRDVLKSKFSDLVSRCQQSSFGDVAAASIEREA